MPISRGMHGPGTPRSIHLSTGVPTLGTMQAGMTLGITIITIIIHHTDTQAAPNGLPIRA